MFDMSPLGGVRKKRQTKETYVLNTRRIYPSLISVYLCLLFALELYIVSDIFDVAPYLLCRQLFNRFASLSFYCFSELVVFPNIQGTMNLLGICNSVVDYLLMSKFWLQLLVYNGRTYFS